MAPNAAISGTVLSCPEVEIAHRDRRKWQTTVFRAIAPPATTLPTVPPRKFVITGLSLRRPTMMIAPTELCASIAFSVKRGAAAL